MAKRQQTADYPKCYKIHKKYILSHNPKSTLKFKVLLNIFTAVAEKPAFRSWKILRFAQNK